MQNKLLKTHMMGIFVLNLLVISLAAQQPQTVAVFDFQKTIEQSVEGKNVISQLQQKKLEINSRLDGFDKEISSLETKLETQKSVLSFEAQQNLAMNMDRLMTQRTRYEEDALKEFQKLQFQLYAKTRKEVLTVIKSLAIEKEFSLVVDIASGGVAYFDPGFDITEEVIKRYNATRSAKK